MSFVCLFFHGLCALTAQITICGYFLLTEYLQYGCCYDAFSGLEKISQFLAA